MPKQMANDSPRDFGRDRNDRVSEARTVVSGAKSVCASAHNNEGELYVSFLSVKEPSQWAPPSQGSPP
jgi:hypothetical protein